MTEVATQPNDPYAVAVSDDGSSASGYIDYIPTDITGTVDQAAEIEAQLEAAYAANRILKFGVGRFYARGVDPNSGWLFEGVGDATVLVSDKDVPWMRTDTNAKAYVAANTTQFTVTAVTMALSFNPLSSDNSYVTRLSLSVNPVDAGLRSKMKCRIHSADEHPYTSVPAASKKARLGEDFEILRVDESSIYVKGRLQWHSRYTTQIRVNTWAGTRKFSAGNFRVEGKKRVGEVTKALVSAKGTGYTTVPTVTPTNTGTGATTTATFAATLQVVGANLTNAGTGYSNSFSVTFSGGGAAKQATGTATASGGVIQSITITNPGDRYTTPPTINLTAGGGSSGAATALMGLGEITVGNKDGTNHGVGYVTAPALVVSGGGGSGGTAVAIANGDCFDADYDVDVSVSSFHAHALGVWYCPGAKLYNITGDDLWEGLIDMRQSPFAETDNIAGIRMCNFKTAVSTWSGRLGYLIENYNSSRSVHRRSACKPGGGMRHLYTDGNTETSTSTGGLPAIWYDLGTTCNVMLDGIEDFGCTGPTIGPHEGCNGLYVQNLFSIDAYQGDEDESYRGTTIQLRGSNIHVNGALIKGGSDAIRYQDTEQPDSVHFLDNIIVRDLTDATENSHAYRGSASTSVNTSKVMIGTMHAHRVGKALRIDSGHDCTVIGKISGGDIGNVFIDVQDGGKLFVNESFSDFTLANSTTTSRKDYNVAGTCDLTVVKHTCLLGAAKNPSTTFAGTPTAATIRFGQRVLINPNAVTEPTLVPSSHAGFTISQIAPSQVDLKIWDASYQFKRRINSTDTLTANRDLTIVLGDADRTLTMTGNATLSGTPAAATQTLDWNTFVEAPTNKTYVIVQVAAFAGTITKTKTKTTSGTATVTVKINTTGLTANSAASGGDSVVQSASNTFVAGDTIQYTVSANASTVDLRVGVEYTRVFA